MSFCVYCFDSGKCSRCGRGSKILSNDSFNLGAIRSPRSRELSPRSDLNLRLTHQDVLLSIPEFNPQNSTDDVPVQEVEFDFVFAPRNSNGYGIKRIFMRETMFVYETSQSSKTSTHKYSFSGRGFGPGAERETRAGSNCGTQLRGRDGAPVSAYLVDVPYPRRLQDLISYRESQPLTTASDSYRKPKVKAFTLQGNVPQLHGN